MIPEYVHGTQNGYSNYGCRCADFSQTAWGMTPEEAVRELAANGLEKFKDALKETQAACSFFRGDAENGLEEIGKIVTKVIND